MVALVPGPFKNSEEYESRRDRSIQDTEEYQSRYHETEGNFFVNFISKRAKCWGCHVLISSESIYDGADTAEDDDFGNGDSP